MEVPQDIYQLYHTLSTVAGPNCCGCEKPSQGFPCLFNSSDAIYSAIYDGTEVIEILRGHEYLSHPFAVSVFGGSVYWTDWRTNTLAKANKWTGNNVTVIQKTSAQPFDLQIYHPSRQPQSKYFGFIPIHWECCNAVCLPDAHVIKISNSSMFFMYMKILLDSDAALMGYGAFDMFCKLL